MAPSLHVVIPFHPVAVIPIPPDPTLVGTTVCLQCTMQFGGCFLSLSRAVSVTIRP